MRLCNPTPPYRNGKINRVLQLRSRKMFRSRQIGTIVWMRARKCVRTHENRLAHHNIGCGHVVQQTSRVIRRRAHSFAACEHAFMFMSDTTTRPPRSDPARSKSGRRELAANPYGAMRNWPGSIGLCAKLFFVLTSTRKAPSNDDVGKMIRCPIASPQCIYILGT